MRVADLDFIGLSSDLGIHIRLMGHMLSQPLTTIQLYKGFIINLTLIRLIDKSEQEVIYFPLSIH